MNLSIRPNPLVERAYTKEGNEYYKSNIGKFAAKTSVGAGAVVLASEIAYKAGKNGYIKLPKAEVIKSTLQGAKENILNFAKKVKIPNIKAIGKKAVDFAKSIKLDKMKNAIKKGGDKVLSFVEKHPVMTGKVLKFATAAALILLAGAGIDALINRNNAKKADKQ